MRLWQPDLYRLDNRPFMSSNQRLCITGIQQQTETATLNHTLNLYQHLTSGMLSKRLSHEQQPWVPGAFLRLGANSGLSFSLQGISVYAWITKNSAAFHTVVQKLMASLWILYWRETRPQLTTEL